MKRLFPLFLLCAASLHAQCAGLSTCTLTSGQAGSAANFQSALNSVNRNTTIIIPSGTFTWSSGPGPNLNTPYSITIQGQSAIATTNAQGNPATFTDSTIIIDGFGGPVFSICGNGSGGTSQLIRITGVTIQQTAQGTYELSICSDGTSAGPGGLRIDHNHFYHLNPTGRFWRKYGVLDHNLVEATGTGNGFQIFSDSSNIGDLAWSQVSDFGGGDFLFMENNTFNGGFANDCDVGGRYVARYNTLMATDSNSGVFQGHATGSVQTPPWRGCRAWEVYKNVFSSSVGGGTFAAIQEYSGTGMDWGNTVTGYVHNTNLKNDRDVIQTNYSQTAPPNGWGYCGTFQSGVTSAWDGNQNLNGSNGSPCLDQPGRGKGDLLQGNFSTVCNATTTDCTNHIYTGSWTHQFLEPVYTWNDTWSCAGCSGPAFYYVDSPPNNIVQNRDYYVDIGASCTAGGACTTGIGTGLSTNKPTTCTAGPGGAYYTSATGSYGVGFWATDTQTLFICTSANTWTSVYTPNVYPHPLDTGGAPPPCANPTIAPGSQIFFNTFSATISAVCTSIIYTTDGSTPTASGVCAAINGTLYTVPVSISATTTLSAIACQSGNTTSGVTIANYTLSTPAPSVPTLMGSLLLDTQEEGK